MRSTPTTVTRTAVLLAALFAAPAIAQLPTPPAGGPPAAAARPDPTAPKPFADIIKEAKSFPGFFTLYQKDDKVWIEIKPEQLNRPFFYQVNSTQGLGEGFLYPNWMLRGHMVEFKRRANLVQLVAKNARFKAAADTPRAHAVKASFTESILGAATVVSLPHPERKSFLIEANSIFLTDLPGTATQLEAVFRMPYALDARNTAFVGVKSTEDMTALSVSSHFAVPKISAPPLTPSPVPTPPPPSTLPDNRSMVLGYYYTLSRLPEKPMAIRHADSRVGHFVTQHWDFSEDLSSFPRKYAVNRWRLEKKDPNAALSEPVKPITFWLGKEVPTQYRKALAEGVTMWNPAFEKIGFKNALVVKQVGEDEGFDPNDTLHASIRWYTDTSDGGLAIGPSRVDPRSGEILDADISFSDGWARLTRRRAVEQLTSVAQGNHHEAQKDYLSQLKTRMIEASLARGELPGLCEHESHAMEEATFTIDLLAARGDIEPNSPEAEKIVIDTLRDVSAHEVGHTLGLTHNFRASTIYSLEQLEDANFTAKNGLAGSVMEYNANNISPKGRKQGEYVQSTLGPYDYWAIEYAYKPLDPATERDELLKIASRSKEPLLAFANDLDAGLGNVEGMDPQVTRRDLGSDPLAFAERRMLLSRELIDRLQERALKPGEQFDHLRRNFIGANAQIALATSVATKYVGGVVHYRDHADSGRAALNPVPAATQRKALKLVTDGLFRAESFKLKPEFVARLVPDQFDRWFSNTTNLAAIVNPDVSISGAVLALQRGALDHLMSDAVAARVLDAPSKMSDAKQAMALSEVYDTLQGAIWSELAKGGDINPLRRNLQREHVRRLVNMLTKPGATTPADAKALQRMNAQQLVAQLRGAMGKAGNKETRAHLSECADLLGEALKANIQRTA
jgi:hypothetical protein